MASWVEHPLSGAARCGDKPALAAEVTRNITSGAKALKIRQGQYARLKGVLHPSPMQQEGDIALLLRWRAGLDFGAGVAIGF